jgi:hypothetical protein
MLAPFNRSYYCWRAKQETDSRWCFNFIIIFFIDYSVEFVSGNAYSAPLKEA